MEKCSPVLQQVNLLILADILQMPNFIAYTAADVANLKIYMDITTSFTLFDYLFLRRVNSAIVNCGDNGIL
jgi:hypothetical protein